MKSSHCELLSPAGGREALAAAVRNGADAVYLGGQMLNARRNAGNFDELALIEAVKYCHERGVRAYVTVNIMLKECERAQLNEMLSQIAEAGADAAIVSDLGVAEIAQKMLPSLPLHLSTQAAVQNAHGVRAAKSLGFSRVVLAREMRLNEIRDAARQGIEVEVFVHGALCSSFSGQCLFSSLIGGRSGNRGLCAQPCRLPYSFGSDKTGYLLSLKDLCMVGHIGALADAGVSGLKLEGRMRRPEYVAIVTRAYRRALDAHYGGEAVDIEELRGELLQIYNRGGFTEGYAMGATDWDVSCTERPNHFGVPVATPAARGFRFTRDIDAKDQLVMRALGMEDVPLTLSGKRGEVVRPALPPGASLIRITSEAQMKRARASYEGKEQKRAVSGAAEFKIGRPATLTLWDGEESVTIQGPQVERAQSGAFSSERAERQLKKSGDAQLFIGELSIDCDEDAFITVAAMNALRRDALNALSERLLVRTRGCEANLAPYEMPERTQRTWPDRPLLCARASWFALLKRAASAGADEIYYLPDILTENGLKHAVPDALFALELPQTAKDADLRALNHWAREHESLIFATIHQNLSHFDLTWPGEIRAGFALNIANREAAIAYSKLGARGFTPSVELTAAEIGALSDMPLERELIVYGKLPLMQLAHCPLNAMRTVAPHNTCNACGSSKGGPPPLVDRRGCAFPLIRTRGSDGCVLSVLNSVPLSVHRRWKKLPACDRATLLFTDEDDIETITALYRALIDEQTQKMPEADFPSTTGHYFRGVE